MNFLVSLAIETLGILRAGIDHATARRETECVGSGHVFIMTDLLAPRLAYIPAARSLRQFGYTPHLVDFADSARPFELLLARAVKTVASSARPDEPVSFLGHGIGGAIAVMLAEGSRSWRRRVKSVITVGTPFLGPPNPLIRYPVETVTGLSGDLFLRHLPRIRSISDRIAACSSAYDWYAPPECSHIPGGRSAPIDLSEHFGRSIGHWELVLAPDVLRFYAELLAKSQVAHSECRRTAASRSA